MFPFNIVSYTLNGGSYIWSSIASIPEYLKVKPQVEIRMSPPLPLWKLAAASKPCIRVAALSGATAVILGAYGFHKQYPEHNKLEQKQAFEIASRYHIFHTVAMLGLPLCRAPYLAATFLLSGIVLFCGSCYHYAFTGSKQYNKLTPIGGVCFIIGWLSMCI